MKNAGAALSQQTKEAIEITRKRLETVRGWKRKYAEQAGKKLEREENDYVL